MMARYYSSSLGRFIASDPAEDTIPSNPQSWNKFAYVRNNPMRHTDPRGTMGQDDVGGFTEALRNMKPLEGPMFTPQQWAQAKEFAQEARENLTAFSIAAAAGTLVTWEVPPVAASLGITSATLGYLAIGCDVLIWMADPHSGEIQLVLVSDGVAIILGKWAGNALEDFLTVPGNAIPRGVDSVGDAATAAGIDAVMDWRRQRRGGTSTESMGDFNHQAESWADQPPEEKDHPGVREHCPGCPSCCGD
jgi:hypothetical protein